MEVDAGIQAEGVVLGPLADSKLLLDPLPRLDLGSWVLEEGDVDEVQLDSSPQVRLEPAESLIPMPRLRSGKDA